MTAALINALEAIRDLPLNTDADVLRDTVLSAREIADKALTLAAGEGTTGGAPLRVYIATVSHRHGVNTYAALSKDVLDSKLADYCRDSWSEIVRSDIPDEPPEDMTDDEIISTYFENHPSEYLDAGDDLL